MKIALLNDTHFGCRNDSPAFIEYQNAFYNDLFFPYLQKNDIKTLIHLGDVVDRRKFINHNTAHNFKKVFWNRLDELGIDTLKTKVNSWTDLIRLINKISEIKVKMCNVKIDKNNPLNEISTSLNSEKFQNKSVIVIDDVLNSGATLMYTVKYFLNTRLKGLKTAVLVDRNHKKYPIKADFKGLSLSTSIQNKVEVSINGDKIEAYLV